MENVCFDFIFLCPWDVQEAATMARGRLWWRHALDDGGELEEHYIVLSKGLVDVYASEEVNTGDGQRKEMLCWCLRALFVRVDVYVWWWKDFKVTKNPLNAKPFKLWQYALVTDYK